VGCVIIGADPHKLSATIELLGSNRAKDNGGSTRSGVAEQRGRQSGPSGPTVP